MINLRKNRLLSPTSNTMPDLNDYVTAKKAAEILGFHPETVRRLVRDGVLVGQKWGKEWLVLKKSVEDYVKQFGDNKHNSRRQK